MPKSAAKQGITYGNHCSPHHRMYEGKLPKRVFKLKSRFSSTGRVSLPFSKFTCATLSIITLTAFPQGYRENYK